MKKKNAIKYMAVALLPLLTGCSNSRHASRHIVVTPAETTIHPDSTRRLPVNFQFHVPEHYLSKRCRLVMTPQLMSGDSLLATYDPVILDAPIYSRKQHRLEKLEHYTDPYAGQATRIENTSKSYDFNYTDSLYCPPGIENARIYTLVQSHGCGRCSQVDTLLAARVSDPMTLIESEPEDMHLEWIEPEFVIRPKVVEGEGSARLQFAMNAHNIDTTLGDNRTELDSIVTRLSPIMTDSLATLRSLAIYGMASADGPLSFNTTLARNRAVSAKNYLVHELAMPASIERTIKTGSRPEGWQPILLAMKADNHPDTVAVQRILEQYAQSNDDVQERYIRRLPSWNIIRQKYLQKDRRVVYAYQYSLRSFTTDNELLNMYATRPDAFNEDEMLRVAALTQGDEKKEEVYRTLVHYFPQSQVATNNLAVLHLRKGDVQEAKHLIESLEDYSDEALNTLAVGYIYSGDYQHAIELLQKVELPEARYNLGLIRARQRRLQEAYELLRPFEDVNSAICALSLNRTEEADRIMRKVDGKSAVEEYVRALIAARSGHDQEVYGHLTQAAADEALARRAAEESDFVRLQKSPEFNKAINPRD